MALKRLLGKALSAAAVIGVAAVGVAAVVTVGSIIGRKRKPGMSNADPDAPNAGQWDDDVGEVLDIDPWDISSDPESHPWTGH